jgi:TM2 domain-containing membrane protein YozV
MPGQPSIAPYDPRNHPPQLRATDAEREHVAGLVRNAVGDGRIQFDELDDRLGAVYEAKTHGDLSVVIDDIVPRSPQPLPRPRPAAVVVPADEASDKLILPGFLLCLFFGMFGAHRFYAGQTRTAVTMLVLTLIAIGAPVTAIWMLVDLVVLGVGSFRDGHGRRMRRWA